MFPRNIKWWSMYRRHMRVGAVKRNSDHVFLRKSEVPAPLIPGSGVASPSLFGPYYEQQVYVGPSPLPQEQELQRRGLSISRQTMSNWIIYAYQHYFPSLFHALHQELLKSEILHADETTLTVLREDGRQARQKSYVWVYRTSGDAVSPVVLYDYQPSRSGVCASNFLQGFTGLLHTDGYEAYHCKLPQEITVAGCWAHMRRKFTDALKTLPKDIRARSPAQVGLEYCNKLFHLEEDYAKQGLSFQERFFARMERSRTVAEEFFCLGERGTGEKSRTKKYVWYGVDLCPESTGLADEYISGRTAGAV